MERYCSSSSVISRNCVYSQNLLYGEANVGDCNSADSSQPLFAGFISHPGDGNIMTTHLFNAMVSILGEEIVVFIALFKIEKELKYEYQ